MKKLLAVIFLSISTFTFTQVVTVPMPYGGDYDFIRIFGSVYAKRIDGNAVWTKSYTTDNSGYSLARKEFKCHPINDRMMRTTFVALYDANDRIITSKSYDDDFEHVLPNSPNDLISYFVCDGLVLSDL